MFDDSIESFLGFNARILYEEYNLSTNPVDILSFDNSLSKSDIAHGMIFKGRKSNILHTFSMDVVPGYKSIDKLRGEIQWYLMESKDIISNICFKSKNKNNQLVSFNGQSSTFRLLIREI